MKWFKKLVAFLRRKFGRTKPQPITQNQLAKSVASMYNPDFSRQLHLPTLEKFGEAKMKKYQQEIDGQFFDQLSGRR